MPLQLKAPIVETYPLMKSDDTGETYVVIRQATRQENEQRASQFADATFEWQDDLVRGHQTLNPLTMEAFEVFLTMADCNIIGKDGSPLFKFKDEDGGKRSFDGSFAEFQKRFGQLPDSVADEIHDKVYAHNPQWDELAAKN